MTRLRNTLIALIIAVPPASASDSIDYLPSPELVQLALQGHPELAAASAERDASGYGAEAVRRGSHEFQASVTPQQRRTPAEGDYREWEAQLGRSVRLPGKARLDAQIATQMRTLADRQWQAAVLAVNEGLLTDWMEWLDAEQSGQLLQRQQQLLADERNAAGLMFDKGALSHLELDLIEADLASAQARLIAARAQTRQARQRLAARFPQMPLPDRAPAIADPRPPAADDAALMQRLLQADAALALARGRADEQALVADRARAERRPDPTVGLRWLREGSDRQNAWGLVLSMPLGGGYRRAQAQQEAARENALHAQAEGVQRDVQQQVHEAIDQMHALRERWQSERLALAAHRSAAERSRRAWELGELGMAAYLLAERALLERQLAEQQLRGAAARAVLALELRAGLLWAGAAQDPMPGCGRQRLPPCAED